MSEVEGSITARLGTGNEELIKAMEALAEAVRKAVEAARVVSLPESEPVKAEQPERFEHRDIDNDRVLVYPHDYPEFQSVLMVETDGDSVRLSQDAVNGLAQYLDWYRTDVVEEFQAEQCGRTTDHPGHEYVREDGTQPVRCLGVDRNPYGGAPGPAVDLNEFYCAGYDGEQPPRKTGCGHPRRAHGALGCNAVTGCPCERWNGS